MGVTRLNPILDIKGQNPEETAIAIMQYLVGFGLTRWHFVEQDLTMAYIVLSCPVGTPLDSALTTFTSIQTVDEKIIVFQKVLNQVLFQDEFTDFRTKAKSTLNRLRTLNDTRNKIAHGMATTVEESGKRVPYFLPFYNLTSFMRERGLFERKWHTSIIKRQEKWSVAELQKKVETLREGPERSKALLDSILALFEDQKATLLKAGRMTLDRGLPFDPSQPSPDQPQASTASDTGS